MRTFTLLLIAILPILTTAQPATNFQWSPRNLGPAGMSGRVTSIAADPNNPHVLYIGAASGGVWRSESGGINWQPIFDDAPLQSVGAVAINPNNPHQIWVGTGEGNPRNSLTTGGGIYRSNDYGKTWQLMGLEKTKTIHRIVPHPKNPNVIYVAATGSAWGAHPERGVFKTSDGGKTWNKILYVNDSTGCADLIIDPQNPDKLIAAMWQHQRQPYFFTSGGTGSGLYVTFNGGETWEKRTTKNGMPKGNLGRIGIAQSASNPKIVYALIEAKPTGFYKSTDGGLNFKLQATQNIGNRPFYYADIFVDPKNENRIYNLWSQVTRSEDGGKTFSPVIGYNKAHPDHHAFYINPNNPDHLIDGNDGGLAISYDRGKNWRFIENLPLGQFYHIAADNAFPYNVYGGLQDNGSWYGPAFNFNNKGIYNNEWQPVLFGDGFDVLPSKSNNNEVFAMWQGGNLALVNKTTGEQKYIQPVADSTPLRYNWNAALADDPHQTYGVYFGAQFLYHSTNNGDTWTRISPDLTTNDSTKQQQVKSGGLTIDATQAENYTTITCIAPSEVDEQVIWVGTDDGNIQLTTNKGESWANVTKNIKSFPANGWVTQIRASTYNKSEAFVVVNNYRNNDYNTTIYHTSNNGKSFTNLTQNLQDAGFAFSIIQDYKEPKLLFAGFENGLYYSINKGESWVKWQTGYPSVNTSDLAIQQTEDDLVIGTFGRGAWILDNIAPLRALAKDPNLTEQQFKVISGGHGYLANYKMNNGLIYPAQAEWIAQNKRNGTPITYWMKEKIDPKTQKADSLKKLDWGKLQLAVLSPSGDTIRKYNTKADTGLHTIYWNMRMDGSQNPSYNLPKKTNQRPSGLMVIPGKYTVAITYGNNTQTSVVEVKTDPRNPKPIAEYEAYIKYGSMADSVKLRLTRATHQLVKMKKEIVVAQQVASLQPDSIKKVITDSCITLTKQINGLLHQVMLPQDFKGYDHVTKRLMDKVWGLYSYLENVHFTNEGNFMKQYRLANKGVTQFVNDVNRFNETHWQGFVSLMEAQQLSVASEKKELE